MPTNPPLVILYMGGSPHVHSFICIFSAPNIENEAACIEFIEKTVNAQLPDHLNDPELF